MTDRYASFGLYALDVIYLQDALMRCVKQEQSLADVFYEELFRLYPRARDWFKDEPTRQRKMFNTILASAAAEMMNPDALEPLLARIGRHHHKKGVTISQLEMGREPFLSAVKTCIGANDFAERSATWNNLYSLLADVMRSGVLRR